MGLMNNYSQHISHIAMDMVVSAGEQIAAGLMAQVLHDIGVKAVPLTGCQAGIVTNNIHTNATISKIKTENILRVSASGVIPIITGFQGITSEGLISTLGRGGSDTSAVELAKALEAEACEIYTDAQGVFSLDPHLSKNARIFTRISHLEMFEMSTLGAKVLHKRGLCWDGFGGETFYQTDRQLTKRNSDCWRTNIWKSYRSDYNQLAKADHKYKSIL